MATFGVEFYDETGQMYLGGDYWATPIVDIVGSPFFAEGVTTGQVSYPELAGCQLEYRLEPCRQSEYLLVDGYDQSTLSVSFDYSAGYPIATYTRSNYQHTSQIAIITITTPGDNDFGVELFNSDGTVCAGTVSAAYKLVGKYLVPKTYDLFSGYKDSYPSSEGTYVIESRVIGGEAAWTHQITVPASVFSIGSRPVFMLDVPIYPAGVRAHMTFPEYYLGDLTGAWVIRVATVGGFDPTVYVFDRVATENSPAISGYGMEIYGASGEMTFATHQKIQTTLPRQQLSLTSPKFGNGTFLTTDTFSIAWPGGVPLLTATTPGSMYSVDKFSKNYASLHGQYSKFWSHDGAGNFRCDWVKIMEVPSAATFGYNRPNEVPFDFGMEISNGNFYG